ncbi:DUF3467 domain-containing protein [bacterium]|jgi:hypothetical protein|nr:DUF3467 domain-containing protein [bacterium]
MIEDGLFEFEEEDDDYKDGEPISDGIYSEIKKSGKNDNSEKALVPKLQLDVEDLVAQGVYSNLAISNYSQEEFVLDFAFLQPHMKKGKIRSRVIISPNNVKKLVDLLGKHLDDYEDRYGAISDTDGNPNFRISFN